MLNKKIISWALYDLANTAFTSPFLTIFWPLLVTLILGGNEFHIGITIACSIVIFSLIVPILGVISDKTNLRKPFVVVPTLTMIALIAFLPQMGLYWNLVVACAIAVLYNISLSIYNSILPSLGSKKDIGKISGLGMATGFFGTLLSLLVAYLTLWHFSVTDGSIVQALWALVTLKGPQETEAGIRAVFPVIAVFFLVFTIPFIFFVRDEGKKKMVVNLPVIWTIARGVFSNIKIMVRLPGMTPYLLYFALFSNALAAIDIFFFLFATKEIHMTVSGFIPLFMAQSFGACAGAFFFGRMADTHGSKKALQWCTMLWLGVIITFVLSKSIIVFVIAGLVGSVAFGGSLANIRTMFLFLSPQKKMGEYFGYAQIISRLAAIAGPVICGYMIVKFNYNFGLLVMILFVAASFVFLCKVPDVRG